MNEPLLLKKIIFLGCFASLSLLAMEDPNKLENELAKNNIPIGTPAKTSNLQQLCDYGRNQQNKFNRLARQNPKYTKTLILGTTFTAGIITGAGLCYLYQNNNS